MRARTPFPWVAQRAVHPLERKTAQTASLRCVFGPVPRTVEVSPDSHTPLNFPTERRAKSAV